MSALHWMARHWFLTWILIAAVATIGWCVWLVLFGESDEQRDARRAREAHERTLARYREIAEEYKRRERAKHEIAMSAAVETVREAMQVSNGEAEAADAEEWNSAASGRRIA